MTGATPPAGPTATSTASDGKLHEPELTSALSGITRASVIALANELAQVADAYGVDISEVIDAAKKVTGTEIPVEIGPATAGTDGPSPQMATLVIPNRSITTSSTIPTTLR